MKKRRSHLNKVIPILLVLGIVSFSIVYFVNAISFYSSASQKMIAYLPFDDSLADASNNGNYGTLVYSTCSIDPEEDEAVIDFLLSKRDAKIEKIDLDIKKSNIIIDYDKYHFNPEIKKCLRIWPQDNNTEGFFVAKIRKH